MPVLYLSIDRNKLAEIIDAPNSELLTKEIVTIKGAQHYTPNAIKFTKNKNNRLTWSLSPYYRIHLFDPDKPIYYDFGPELEFSYKLKPGLLLNADIEKSMISTFNQIHRGVKGSLPKVRTDLKNYLNVQETRINELTLSSYYKFPSNFYGRTTLGYLESMYAGVSSEILYSPQDKNFSLGMEVNYVNARGYEQRFLRELNGLSKLNGHFSGYWDTNFYDYLIQLDAGRYLAGDIGNTFTLSRNFKWMESRRILFNYKCNFYRIW